MDSTTPDPSAFFARGGKLIIRENAGDHAQSATMGYPQTTGGDQLYASSHACQSAQR